MNCCQPSRHNEFVAVETLDGMRLLGNDGGETIEARRELLNSCSRRILILMI